MFSTISSIENIVVYRLAFEKQDGTIEWWKSEFYRYPEFVGKKLAPVLHSSGTNHKTTIVSLLQKNKLLLDVIRLMELE
jgi:hypothetical protein